jgi:hypothetical protein
MPRLRLLRLEDTIKPGNKMVMCQAKSYTVGSFRFKQGVPTEVTPKQFEGLMAENARLGRVIFREYAFQGTLEKEKRTSLTDLFENLPNKARVEEPVIVPELESALQEEAEEPDFEEESPRKVVGKRMTIKEGPTRVGKRMVEQTTGEEVEEDDGGEETVVVRTRKKKVA